MVELVLAATATALATAYASQTEGLALLGVIAIAIQNIPEGPAWRRATHRNRYPAVASVVPTVRFPVVAAEAIAASRT